jgi:tyrosyl-tRNA synthetase
VALTMPILAGTDGVEKMSKSLDNCIGVSESPRDMYGKTLRIPDGLIVPYFELTTDVSNAELVAIRKELASGANPRDLKRRLARTIVALYHSEVDARSAEEEFDRIFIQKSLPDEVEEITLAGDQVPPTILALLSQTKLAASNSDARRLIEQGGVTIDGEKVSNPLAPIPAVTEFIVKVGKRRFLKVLIAPRS